MTRPDLQGAAHDAALAPLLRDVVALADAGNNDGLIALAEARFAAAPNDATGFLALAYAAFAADRVVLCLEALQQALDAAPGSAVTADCLATLYAMAGEVPEATYYAKLAVANGFGAETMRLRPAAWPDFAAVFANASEHPFLARGLHALAGGDLRMAIHALEAQAAFSPNHGETQRALADALMAAGQPRRAADILSRFAANGTADAWDLARLARCLATVGDFDTARGILAEASDDDDPEAAAELFAAGLFTAALHPLSPACPLPRSLTGQPLVAATDAPLPTQPRIGILATALGPERDLECLAQLAAGLRERGATVVVFGAGTLSSAHNRPLQGKVQTMIDAAGFDGATLAFTIRSEAIDLLIDAGGVYAPLHLAALAHHPAPRVAGWLNLPFAADALGLDRSLGAEPPASGLIARLGLAPQLAVSHPQPLIGADVWAGQLHEDFLAAVAAILRAAPEARLLLRDRNLSHPDTVATLVERCTAHGFVDRIEIVEGDDLSFAAGLDLLLAPFAALSGHDVVSATAVATPAVALAGDRPWRRQGADALAALGLGERIAVDTADYIAKALTLLADPAAARQVTAARAATAPAFAAGAFAAGLIGAFSA